VRTIYLAHPLSAETAAGIEKNRTNAARWGIWIAKTFPCAVSADWIWWSMVLDETPENRALGLSRDFVQISKCQELWLVGGRVSGGMQLESDYAKCEGVPVRDLTSFGRLSPAFWPKLVQGDIKPFVDRVLAEWGAVLV
jgi:hypothetical protein